MRITSYECRGKTESPYPDHNVAFYCENCGTEQASLFETYDGKLSVLSVYECFLKSDHQCPICGKVFQKKPGYFLPAAQRFIGSDESFAAFYGVAPLKRDQYTRILPGRNQLRSVDEKFARITEIREKAEKLQMQNAVETLAQGYDLPSVASNPKANFAEIKHDLEKLKEYIHGLINLENNINSLKQRLASLYFERMQNERYIVRYPGEKFGPINEVLQRWKKRCDSSIDKLQRIQKEKPKAVSVSRPKKPVEPLLKTPGLFNKKKVLAENEALTAQYHADMEAYRAEVAKCNAEKARLTQEAQDKYAAKVAQAQQDVEDAKKALAEKEAEILLELEKAKKLPSPATAIKALLDNEISGAENLLSRLFAARNELYAYDIIFVKYRDVVALSSFYEYLMSGRCTTLDGADGAYNIYENEIRANRVISQLDTVISSLEDIKQNQYMMYQELRNTNAMLSSLNSTMSKALTSIQSIEANTSQMNEYLDHISKNSDVIAHNTAATAYYSKVNAELTNALGYMVAFS